MQIDQHREHLRERLVGLTTLVEGAFVATIALAAERPLVSVGRLPTIHDDIVALALDIHSEGVEFLVRFRPVATDLQFVTTVLGCSADLQVAAVAIDAFSGLLERIDVCTLAKVVPSLDRMTARAHVVVTLASDAISAWDATAYDAVREAHGDVIVLRERVRQEVAAEVVTPLALIERLLEVDAAGCMIEHIAALAVACVRRLARVGTPVHHVPLVPS